ncbi:MAG: hypothetical protein ACE5NW_08495 [Acidiferrobacterales bacterium]
MVFAYYRRLSAVQKRVYRRSDEVASIRLPRGTLLQPLVARLATALRAENKQLTQTVCQQLTDGITASLEVPSVRVEVLAVRPHDDWGELHGLYSPAEGQRRSTIELWMRTAQRKKTVAFRTFLRTLLHELCHHLDYELLQLPDSFHTEGFYKRISSLFHQLVPTD